MQTLYFSTNYVGTWGHALGEDTHVHDDMFALVQGVHIWNEAILLKVPLNLAMLERERERENKNKKHHNSCQLQHRNHIWSPIFFLCNLPMMYNICTFNQSHQFFWLTRMRFVSMKSIRNLYFWIVWLWSFDVVAQLFFLVMIIIKPLETLFL